MKIGIIGAMSDEIAFLLHNMTDLKENITTSHVFYTGTCAGCELVVVRGGVGKVASGIVFSALHAAYTDLDLIVNVGTCGGIAGRVKVGEIVVPANVAYADADVTYGNRYSYGQVPGFPPKLPCASDLLKGLPLPPHRTGMILSGDTFFHDGASVMELVEKHFPDDDVLALDMESAALAQCAYFFKKDFLVIRAVSDLIGGDAQAAQFVSNLEMASRACNEFLLTVLKNIK